MFFIDVFILIFLFYVEFLRDLRESILFVAWIVELYPIFEAHCIGISGGQALGQKNTILAIWMAHTYLNPLSSVAPGSYVLWQNIINSWQLWKKRKARD